MTPNPVADPGLAAVERLAAERMGLVFTGSRRASAAAGMRRAMERAGVADAGPFAELVERDQATRDDLVSELTVGEMTAPFLQVQAIG